MKQHLQFVKGKLPSSLPP